MGTFNLLVRCTRLLNQTCVVIRAHSVIAEVTLMAWLRKVSCPDVHEVSVHIFTSVTGPQVKQSLEVDTRRPHPSAAFSGIPA